MARTTLVTLDVSPDAAAVAKKAAEHFAATVKQAVAARGMARVAISGGSTPKRMFALLSQEGQVRCFANVARRLKPGGAFVVQAFVPDLGRFRQDQRVGAFEVDSDSVGLDASLHDPIEQRVTSQHVVLTPRGAKLYPVELRYAFPSELDLMARLARLELESRHAGWCGEDFTADSHGHVSVYRKAPARRSSRAR